MKYLVTTWDGHTYFVDTCVSASGYRAEFNGTARVAETPEIAVTKLAANNEWAIKNVQAASPVECFKQNILDRVEAFRSNRLMGISGPDELISHVLKVIRETPA